jgi:tetratricopeptide (TPR) repeat protein
MLRRLFDVRLRSAEQALRAGRLDDAYRVATMPDLRSDRRGLQLLGKLAPLFLERAREHVKQDRFEEAYRDLERASTEAPDKLRSQIDELQRHIDTIVGERDRMDRSRHVRLDEARRQLNAGALEAGKQLMRSNDAHDPEVKHVEAEIGRRERIADHAYDRADDYLKNQRWSSAADELRKAFHVESDDERGHQLRELLIREVLGLAAEAFRVGRLRQARSHFDLLHGLTRRSVSCEDFGVLLETAERAGDAIRRHDFDKAMECVLRIERLAPNAKWLRESARQIETAEQAMTSLLAGPLTEMQERLPAGPARISMEDTRPIHRPAGGGVESSLPSRLVVLVDGGGSYLVLRRPSITIGRAMSSKQADVPIFAPLKDRHAEIRRIEDEFFLVSSELVDVAGRTGKQHLLHDHDRIVLDRKAKLTFYRPSRRSASCVLDLSDSTKAPSDIRRVVLFHQTAMMGRGRKNHMVCPTVEESLVVFERSGGLWIKSAGGGMDGGSAMPIELGRPMQYGGAAFVVRPWPGDEPGVQA